MSNQFEQIYKMAQTSGINALNSCVPEGMVVRDSFSGRTWSVPEGPCGFAWVQIKGNTSFGRWAKKSGLASSAYPKGLMFWVSYGGQSMERKEAYARAFAAVLRENNIEAYADSRMD